jgi:hypothetical protein
MRVAGRGHARVRVVDAADDVDVVAHRRERREARRQLVVRADLARDPVALGNAVAVEPEDEPRLERRAAPAVAAYAVPFELNIAASGGRPTRIAAPVMLMFLRNRRLLSGMAISLITVALPRRTAVTARARSAVP